MLFIICYEWYFDYVFFSCVLVENKYVRLVCNGLEEEKDYDLGNFYKFFYVVEVYICCWFVSCVEV